MRCFYTVKQATQTADFVPLMKNSHALRGSKEESAKNTECTANLTKI